MTNVIRSAPKRNYDRAALRKRLAERYQEENERCAQTVLDNLDRYGRGSLLHQWADATLNGPQAANREWWRRTA